MSGESLQQKVVITNPQGLHMRPSAAFVELASRYQSSVTVSLDGRVVNGKSLWDLLMLAAMPGSELLVEVSGPDASTALEALVACLRAPPPEDVLEPPRSA